MSTWSKLAQRLGMGSSLSVRIGLAVAALAVLSATTSPLYALGLIAIALVASWMWLHVWRSGPGRLVTVAGGVALAALLSVVVGASATPAMPALPGASIAVPDLAASAPTQAEASALESTAPSSPLTWVLAGEVAPGTGLLGPQAVAWERAVYMDPSNHMAQKLAGVDLASLYLQASNQTHTLVDAEIAAFYSAAVGQPAPPLPVVP